jgi:hypothetical protein
MLISCLAYFSALKTDVICSSAKAVNFHPAARCYVPEAVTLPREHIFQHTSLFWKSRIRLMRSPRCLCVCVSRRYQLSMGVNQSLYNLVCITLRWAHVNGILHKYLTSVSLPVFSPIVASQRLDTNIPAVTNTHVTIELCSPCHIKESKRLVLPITSCYYWCGTFFTKWRMELTVHEVKNHFPP